MKRLPVILSFVLFIGLCAAIAYWVMEYSKPPLRPIAPPPREGQSQVSLTSAAGLFGGSRAVAVASNYQLRGVVVAGDPTESVAILAADGKPAQAVTVGREIIPGTVVKEVQPRHVLLSEGGIIKRVDLPNEVPSQGGAGAANPLAGRNFPGLPQLPHLQPQAGVQPQQPPQQSAQMPPRPGQIMPVPQMPPQQPAQGNLPPEQPDESGMPPTMDEQGPPDQQQGTPIPETGMPPGFPPPDVGPENDGMNQGMPPEQQGMPAEQQPPDIPFDQQQGLPPELQQ